MLITTEAGQPFPVASLVHVAGDIDFDEHDALRDSIVACGVDGMRVVVLDLSAVTYMGSSGLSALLGAREQLLGRNIRLCIDDCSPMVSKLLEVTGLGQYLGNSEELYTTD